jgi:hypothetical protein
MGRTGVADEVMVGNQQVAFVDSQFVLIEDEGNEGAGRLRLPIGAAAGQRLTGSAILALISGGGLTHR